MNLCAQFDLDEQYNRSNVSAKFKAEFRLTSWILKCINNKVIFLVSSKSRKD